MLILKVDCRYPIVWRMTISRGYVNVALESILFTLIEVPAFSKRNTITHVYKPDQLK